MNSNKQLAGPSLLGFISDNKTPLEEAILYAQASNQAAA